MYFIPSPSVLIGSHYRTAETLVERDCRITCDFIRISWSSCIGAERESADIFSRIIHIFFPTKTPVFVTKIILSQNLKLFTFAYIADILVFWDIQNISMCHLKQWP